MLLTIAKIAFATWQVENAEGALAWQSAKEQLLENGIAFDLTELAPEPVSAEDNFWETPLLRGVVLDREMERQDRLKAITLIPEGFEKKNHFQGHGAIVMSRRRSDLSPWYEFVEGDGAEAILDALNSKFGAEFAELAKAAQRPHSCSPYPWELTKDVLAHANALLHHNDTIIRLTRTLNLRTRSAIEVRNGESALESIQIQIRLAEAVSYEPSATGHLFFLLQQRAICTSVWEGLASEVWNRQQLQRLISELERLDPLRSFAMVMECELVMQTQTMELMRDPNVIMGMDSKTADLWTRLVFKLFLPGVVERNKVIGSVWMLENLVIPAREGDWQTLSDAALPDEDVHWRTKIAFLTIASLERFPQRVAYEHILLQSALAACEIEIHRIDNGKYPDELPNPRLDLDGEPLRYQKTPDGRYQIYSIGWDFVDDGGVPSKVREFEKNDWVWAYGPPAAAGSDG